MKKTKILSILLVIAMMMGLLSIGATATVPTYNNIEIQFGDPNYPSTWPENMMSLSLTNTPNTYNAVYDNGNSSYYPSILSLYAFYSTNNDVTLTSNDTSAIQFVTYNQYGNEVIDSDGIINYNQNSNWNSQQGAWVKSNLFAVKIIAAGSITITNSVNDSVTINFSNPQSAASPAGSTPMPTFSMKIARSTHRDSRPRSTPILTFAQFTHR